MINWTWEIVDLQRETTDGFVFSARYILCGQQTVGSITYYDSRGGTISFLRPNSLTPYADLTESQVVTWVKDKLGTSGLASEHSAGDTALAARIASTGNDAYGIPWS